MTGWGEVLEAMHLAPRGTDAVHLVVSHQHPDATGAAPAADAPAPPVERAGVRSSITSWSAVAVSGPDDPSRWRSGLWCDAGARRYRVRHGHGPTTVVDGVHRWSEMGDGRVVQAPVGAQPEQEILLLLTNPEVLLGWFRFEDHDETTALDRPAHWIRGSRRASPMGAVLDIFLPGNTVDAIVDAETGVLLDLHLRSDWSPTFSLRVTECGFDDFDPDEVLRYDPPPGSRVLTPEMLHDEVRAELVAQHGPRMGLMGGLDVRPPLADVSMAIGPPPEDVDGAAASIRYAVEHLTDIDDHDRCPNIQGGANLAGCVRQTRRSPYVDEDHGATFECREIAFVRADEADVRFRVVVPKAPGGGIDTQGRALLIEGRWVIDRATACGLFSMAGVTCPPPPAPGSPAADR